VIDIWSIALEGLMLIQALPIIYSLIEMLLSIVALRIIDRAASHDKRIGCLSVLKNVLISYPSA
jgi:hypothetical protein